MAPILFLGGNWEAEAAALEAPSDAEIAALKTAWQARHEQVLQAGGLHVIGTERHESRRIDNQLRGRRVGKVIQVTLGFICP